MPCLPFDGCDMNTLTTSILTLVCKSTHLDIVWQRARVRLEPWSIAIATVTMGGFMSAEKNPLHRWISVASLRQVIVLQRQTGLKHIYFRARFFGLC